MILQQRSTKADILRKTNARYVYIGPGETAMGGIDPSLPLTKVYDSAGVTIYESNLVR